MGKKNESLKRVSEGFVEKSGVERKMSKFRSETKGKEWVEGCVKWLEK